MKKMLVLFLLLLLASNLCAQKNADSLDEKLKRLQSQSDFPGFAAAIVNRDGVLYQNGFGYADAEKKTPYTARTVQPIGSVSKTFIGAALMKAVETGALSLETNVNDVLPFKVFNPYFPSQPIKIKHLAAHTSGIVDRAEIYEKTYIKAKQTTVPLKEFLADYLTEKGKHYSKSNFSQGEPGAVYNYSNIGATLAAYIIETQTGMSFADYTAKFIFEPLKMKDTNWFYDDEKAARYAVLYDGKSKPLPIYSSITYPDGSLRTSVEDLSKYLVEMIRGSAGESNLLSKKSFQTLFAKQFPPNDVPKNTNPREPNQGVFWVFRANGQIGHTGSDLGVSAFLFFNPEKKIGKIFLTNADLEENKKLAAQFIAVWKTLEEYEDELDAQESSADKSRRDFLTESVNLFQRLEGKN